MKRKLTCILLALTLLLGAFAMTSCGGFNYEKEDLSKYVKLTAAEYNALKVKPAFVAVPADEEVLDYIKAILVANKEADGESVTDELVVENDEVTLYYIGRDEDGNIIDILNNIAFDFEKGSLKAPETIVIESDVTEEDNAVKYAFIQAMLKGQENLGFYPNTTTFKAIIEGDKDEDDKKIIHTINPEKDDIIFIEYSANAKDEAGNNSVYKSGVNKTINLAMTDEELIADGIDEHLLALIRAAIADGTAQVGPETAQSMVTEFDTDDDGKEETVTYFVDFLGAVELVPYTISLTMPEDYEDAAGKDDLAGQTVTIDLYCTGTTHFIIPEFDATFVKNAVVSQKEGVKGDSKGVFGSTWTLSASDLTDEKVVEEAEKAVLDVLVEEADHLRKTNLYNAVWNAVYDKAEVTGYPEREVEGFVNETLGNLEYTYYNNANLQEEHETLLAYQLSEYDAKTEEELENKIEIKAKKVIKQKMLVHYIADLENITYTDDDYDAYLEETAQGWIDYNTWLYNAIYGQDVTFTVDDYEENFGKDAIVESMLWGMIVENVSEEVTVDWINEEDETETETETETEGENEGA